ncbi:MAG TPA: GntR family transcriptional regulator [Ideonella sp.]|uniref:FadR/GntR family transcriptional regulator n=1 Tax=Ideonella sp. TaxID=1929293 RepID=UPI002D1B3CCB|nr:GntR family transcriptional regulator [Ideonella sp.]HSI50199.1 GntR family transcriptional regulator [Ideonella sp.]
MTLKPKTELRPLARGGAAEQILDDLRERILNGSLKRGDKLPTEREMAQGYGVSGATVREAIRALVTIHLIEVRHGSGAYVTANAEQLIAQSLGSMIQLERIEVQDVMGLLGVLNAYCAELAATRATPEDLAELRAAVALLEHAAGAADSEAGLTRFLLGLAAASHNPLLAPICRFLAGLQIDLARQTSGGSAKVWREATASLHADRHKLVEAIARHDAAKARTLALACHQRALKVIAELG